MSLKILPGNRLKQPAEIKSDLLMLAQKNKKQYKVVIFGAALATALIIVSIPPAKALSDHFSDASAPTAANVAVIYNTNWTEDQDSNGVQDSLQVAQAYQAARNIPITNICGIPTTTYEQTSMAGLNIITTAVTNCLEGMNSIRYLVLTKGVPLRIYINDPNFSSPYESVSVDSDLVFLGQEKFYRYLNGTSISPYYQADIGLSGEYTMRHRFKPDWYEFKWQQITNGVSVDKSSYMQYLVTRLDAPKLSTVLEIIEKSLYPADLNNSIAILDGHPGCTNSNMITAASRLGSLSAPYYPNPFESTSQELTTASQPVWAYVGHGKYAGTHVGELQFAKANGAIYSTYESFNLTSLRQSVDPNLYSPNGQTWCSQWLEAGGTVCLGNAQEPFGSGIPREDVFLPLLYAGYNLADAAYMSFQWPLWVNVVVGDPLMTFARTSDTTPPQVVSSISSNLSNPLGVTVNWSASASSDVQGYYLYRSTAYNSVDLNNPSTVLVATLPNNQTSYIDSQVTSHWYSYGLVAFDGAGNQSAMAITSILVPNPDTTPPALVSFTATPNQYQITLTWGFVDDSSVNWIALYRSTQAFSSVTDPGVEFLNFQPSTSNSFTNTNLQPNTTYYYGIVARDSNSNTSQVAVIITTTLGLQTPADTTPPSPPYNFSATASTNQIILSWSPSASSDVAGYRLYRSGSIISNLSNPTVVYVGELPSISRSYTNSNLAAGASYYFALVAYDGANNISPAVSTHVTTTSLPPTNGDTVDTTPPSAPGIPVARGSNGIIALTWTLSSSSDVESYELYRSTNPISTINYYGVALIATLGSSISTYTDTRRTASTTYYYALRSRDGAGNVSGLVVASATAPAAGAQDPAENQNPPSPFFQAGSHQGQLVKSTSNSAVYYISANGKRYVFFNEGIFYSWYDNFNNLVTISEEELSGYPIGGNVRYRPGTKLVKITSDPKVYAVQPEGILRHIPDETTAMTLYGPSWASRVNELPDVLFTPPNYEIGTPLASGGHDLPDGYMAGTPQGETYIIASGLKRRLASTAARVMNRLNERWAVRLDSQTLVQVADGQPISSQELHLAYPEE
jgi:hypothetical protein